MPVEQTPKQQWSEQVRSANRILIIPHANPDGDAVGSTLALKLVLEKLSKEVVLAVSGEIPQTFAFLKGFSSLQKDPHLQKDLLLVLDESQGKIGNISLKRVAENKLIVVVTPKDGLLSPANVRVEEGTFNVDLIIALDCADADRIGDMREKNPSLFFDVPVINVDHHPGNTNFGKINIVDTAASSTAEILVALIETLAKEKPDLLDPDSATSLLTGVITDTGSFQNGNTTPKSMTVAAQLIAAGARQQEIIKNVFKTRSLSTLRLWGRALSYLKEDSGRQFIWTMLGKSDFVAAQAKQDESSGVIDELLKTAAGMRFVLLLTERDGGIHGSMRSIEPSTDVSLIANQFGGGGHPQAAAFYLENKTLKENEQELINRVRDYIDGKTRLQANA